MNEGIIFSIILLILILFKIWKNRKIIMEWYINGYNLICHKAGIPPYIPKKNMPKGKE